MAGGAAPYNATARMAERQAEEARVWNRQEVEEFFGRVRDAWLASGAAWADLLEGIVLAHEGNVLALFHEYGLKLGWNLGNVFRNHIPHAKIDTDEFSWAVAKVPAIFSLFLREGYPGPGLGGLVLADDDSYRFDTPRCGLFLCNLLVDLLQPQLADFVRIIEPGDAVAACVDDDKRRPQSDPRPQLDRFSARITARGLTRDQCLPALRAALHNTELSRDGQ